MRARNLETLGTPIEHLAAPQETTLDLLFRLTGRVADLDDTTPDEPEHPSRVLIIECGEDLARIVIPASVWSPKKRDLLAIDRPVAVTGEGEVDPFRPGARAVATSLKLLDSFD